MLPDDMERCDGAHLRFGKTPLAPPCRDCARRTDVMPFDSDRLYTWMLPPAQLTDNGWQCEMRIAPEGY